MYEDKPLLQMCLPNQTYLRVYAYPYQDEVRLTISLENEEFVLASENVRPLFCPFTGKRNCRDESDTKRLLEGISLKISKSKVFLACCILKGPVLSLHLGSSSTSWTFAFDPLTGLADTSYRL